MEKHPKKHEKAGHVEITVAPEKKEEKKEDMKEEEVKKDPFIEGRIKKKLWKGVKFFWKQKDDPDSEVTAEGEEPDREPFLEFKVKSVVKGIQLFIWRHKWKILFLLIMCGLFFQLYKYGDKIRSHTRHQRWLARLMWNLIMDMVCVVSSTAQADDSFKKKFCEKLQFDLSS